MSEVKGFDLSTFATDPESEESGVWVDLGDGAAIRVARMGNKKHVKTQRRLMKPHRGLLQSGRSLSDDVADAIAVKVTAETILVDWKGLLINGKPVEYSVEKAIEILSDPVFRNFSDMVAKIASSPGTFNSLDQEELEKN